MLKPLPTTVEDLVGPRPYLVFLEASIITLLLPGLGLWLRPQDPFFLHASFPWLVLAPLLLSLRYGFAQGLGCATVLSLLMLVCSRAGQLGVREFPIGLALGLILIAMLAGEFCDMWHRRLHRLNELNHHHHTLVQKFTRSYHLLSLSHAQLERRVQANTTSLRETMTYLRQRALSLGSEPADRRELHHLMMEVLSSFGLVQVGAMYLVDEFGIFVPEMVAKLGNPKPILIDDPMVLQALDTKQLTCIKPEETLPLAADQSGTLRRSESALAVLPLVDVHERVWAVVTVQAMPFESFSSDHLTLLAVLGGQMGDLMALGPVGGLQQFHTCLLRSHSDARDNGLSAVLIGLVVDREVAPPNLLRGLLDQHRGLDQQWLARNPKGHDVILMVMPLTDADGARGFLQRLEAWCSDGFGRSLSAAGVRAHQVLLDGSGQAQDKLRALRTACELHAE